MPLNLDFDTSLTS